MADDLRAHSGVTCRLCHRIRPPGTATAATRGRARRSRRAEPGRRGVDRAPPRGLRSCRWAPSLRRLPPRRSRPTWRCRCTCRGSTGPARGATPRGPATAWRGSTRSTRETCIDCHMEREPASAAECGQGRYAGLGVIPWQPHLDGGDAQRRPSTCAGCQAGWPARRRSSPARGSSDAGALGVAR